MGAKHLQSNANLKNIKSNYILSKIFIYLKIMKKLRIVNYNKKIQKRLNITNEDYKEYSSIEIEIIPIKDFFH